MTIEEYLNDKVALEDVMMKRFEKTEGEYRVSHAYHEGRRDAFKDTLEMLPSFEHEITVKEVKDFCEKRGEHEHIPCEMYCSIYNECPYYSNFPLSLINIEQLKSDMARGDTYEEEYWNDEEN